jgi:hypothetical protein
LPSPRYRRLHGSDGNGASIKMVATELCRERLAEYMCDGRSDLSELQRRFPHVDFAEVTEEKDSSFGVVLENATTCGDRYCV